MKVEALKEFIRKEIRSIIREEIGGYMTEVFSGKSGYIKSNTSSTTSGRNDDQIVENKENSASNKKFVKYTSNDVLNQVLNETTGGVPQEGTSVSYDGGLSGQIDSTADIISESVQDKNVPEPIKGVASAMTRDYRDLMKAVDKKVANKR